MTQEQQSTRSHLWDETPCRIVGHDYTQDPPRVHIQLIDGSTYLVLGTELTPQITFADQQ
jgi:hypothetical protein